MFVSLKNQVKSNFEKIVHDKQTIFQVEVDRERIWELYLDGFDPDKKQEYDCSSCRSFLRQYSGIVVIENNQMKSIWDIPLEEIEEEYRKSIHNIQSYIHSLSISNVFLNTFKKLGTDKNYDPDKDIYWNHFYLDLTNYPKFVHRGSDTIDSVLGDHRTTKEVLKRSLEELTDYACKTVLELIAQGSLYRGNEFEAGVKAFHSLKEEYNNTPDDQKDNFCWVKSTTLSKAVTRIRNSAIGTLLIDLSNEEELDKAVSAFERVVAPTNYKRPTSLITSRMIEDAQSRIQELGYVDSLERRFASAEDLNVSNLLFVDRSSELKDIFKELQKDVQVNPKTLSKVEEIGIEDFLANVVPKAKSIEVLLENSHLNNMVSLITAVDESAPTMFKWPNEFSWSYTGGITDSIKEKVKAAGGNVVGELRVSLSWHNFDDLDLHIFEPKGDHIYYGHKTSYTSRGTLDVDMNAVEPRTRQPVENVIWVDKNRMPEGKYVVRVNQFSKRETTDMGYVVEVECNGEVFTFERDKSPVTTDTVVEFEYSRTKGITIKGDVKSNVVSKSKWGVNTNQFTKVKNIMLSPNHWDSAIGNKHYMFMLEDCINDESPRPFFNEFLKEDLLKDRKVFEVLASKLKVEPSTNQLSGVGFSETQRNHLLVRVQGTFRRNLKINF